MTAYILGAATLILLVLIIWRRSSPEFKKKSEQPKFQFLANLGFGSHRTPDRDPAAEDNQTSLTKGPNENPKP